MPDKMDPFQQAAYISRIEDQYQILSMESTRILNALALRFGETDQNNLMVKKANIKLDSYYFGARERIRDILLNQSSEELGELDTMLYNGLQQLNQHGSIRDLGEYEYEISQRYYAPLITQAKGNMQPYINEVEENYDSYVLGFSWLGESNGEFNDSDYYYKIYQNGDNYYMIRILRTELKDDADYPGEILFSSDPEDGREVLYSPMAMEAQFAVLSSRLDDVYQHIDEVDTDIAIKERSDKKLLEEELKKTQEEYEDVCAELDKQLEEQTVVYEKEKYLAEFHLEFERDNHLLSSDDVAGSYQRAVDTQTERIRSAIIKLKQVKTDFEEYKKSLELRRYEASLGLQYKENELTELNKTINALKEDRIRSLENYLHINRDEIDKYGYNTYCNFLVATIVEEHSKQYVGSDGFDVAENLRIDKKSNPRSANAMYDYLLASADEEGKWEDLSALESNNIVNTIGVPVVAGWQNEDGKHGHVAVVSPGYIPEREFNELSMHAYAAGASSPGETTIGGTFGSSKVNQIRYFILRKDYEKYEARQNNLSINELVDNAH